MDGNSHPQFSFRAMHESGVTSCLMMDIKATSKKGFYDFSGLDNWKSIHTLRGYLYSYLLKGNFSVFRYRFFPY